MSTNLFGDRHRSTPVKYVGSSTFDNQRSRRKSTWIQSGIHLEDNEESRFLTVVVMWMTILALGPLILFYIITALTPDLFLIPVTPR